MIRAQCAKLQVRVWLCACALSVPLSGHAQQARSPSAAAQPSAPAQSAAPASQIVSSAPKPPFPNRLNSVLPTWLRTRGEFRERMEGFDGANFNSTRDDLYWLTRFRFGATVTASKSLSFQAQVHDARVGKKTVGATGSPFRAPFDLRMGFADIGSSTSRLSVRAGRQELVYGDQRLVGHLGWTNAARSFDAVKVTMRGKAASLDLFGASVVRTIEDGFDKSGAGNRFAGAYLTLPKLVKSGSLEPYLFWRRDTNLPGETGTVGDLKASTAGARFAGKLPLALDYNIEMAVQRGSLGSDDIQAWAGHWQLRESLSGPGAIKLIGEFNYASGDENPTDGVRGTFDQLYPTGHDKYGLADQIGWRNIQHARAGFEFTPFKTTPVTTSYHSWWLAEKRDGIYTAGGAPLARVAGGAASAHVGEEIDVQISRALTPQMQVSGGYAHIFPGAFLEQATPGASYSYPYVQVTYVFLAER
ncbi:MAG TPA: alginate export family protein [Vicinamibacterales bacterium]|nr:alginate export family protein [Vicinamibacterales bacterium]